jgi:hypothetical protein
MKMTTLTATLTAIGGLVFLASCVETSGGSDISSYSTSCMFEVNPPGSYVFNDGDSEVKPGGGGTAEGAAAMNDCIRRKAEAAGTSGAMTERTTVETTGDTTVKTYTYGQPPAAPAASSKPTATAGKSCRNRNVLSGGSGYYGCTP